MYSCFARLTYTDDENNYLLLTFIEILEDENHKYSSII